jgi:hypothetical protein
MRTSTSLLAAALLGWIATPAAGDAVSSPACPQTSAPTTWTGNTLDVNTTKSGTVYNPVGADLELNKAGAVFNTKQMSTNSTMVYAAVGDFNRDGWPDFVGASENSASGYLDIFHHGGVHVVLGGGAQLERSDRGGHTEVHRRPRAARHRVQRALRARRHRLQRRRLG